MAGIKHTAPLVEEPDGKRLRHSTDSEPQKRTTKQCVVLNPADCNLADFSVEGDGLQGHALHEQGFAYCWSGARANVGITRGRYCFGCKIISEQPVEMQDTSTDQQHVARVGISRGDDEVGNLGESGHSFGFGGTGKFSTAGKFIDFGKKFGVGDTVVCAVDLESKPLASVGFSMNGKWLGIARLFDAGPKGLGVIMSSLRRIAWGSALFPHVLLKNVVVQLQFSIEDGLVPEEGYKPWDLALQDGNAIMGPVFSNPKDCEVLMMVGLPASGKTTWAEKWVKEHPEKRYVVLGTNLALDQMKVPGLLRKQNYGERFERLMDQATGIFNTVLARAAKTPRNYILDQTNVYKSARKRKLKAFMNYRKIAVVVFPTADELKFRADKRFKEMGKEVPADAVNDMLANYVLPMSNDMPGSDEFFDEVIFSELNRGDAQRILDEMKREVRYNANSLAKSNISPYSHESSIQSHSSFMGSVTGTGQRQNFHSPLSYASEFRSPQQVGTAFSALLTNSGADFSPTGYQSGMIDSYGTQEIGLRSGSAYSYGRPDDYPGGFRPMLSDLNRPPRRDNPHGSYGRYDPQISTDLERPISSFPHTSPQSHSGDPRLFLCSLQDARETGYQKPYGGFGGPPSSYSGSYGTPPPKPSYQSMPLSHYSGSPYGTPPPRPSYENMPPMSHYSGSPYGTPPRPPPYTPPGPRY
ncbi:hypothetical protein AMTRI_Chr02g218380 [Amborella trichopoda]